MSYDFHGDWEKNVSHNAPLFALNGASDYQKKLTVVSVNPNFCLYIFKLARMKSDRAGLLVNLSN